MVDGESMDFDFDWFAEEEEAPTAKRTHCARCGRPTNVCICDALPSEPLQLQTPVLLWQHPAEGKRRLATGSILKCCLAPDSFDVAVACEGGLVSYAVGEAGMWVATALPVVSALQLQLAVVETDAAAAMLREVRVIAEAAGGGALRREALHFGGMRSAEIDGAPAACDCDAVDWFRGHATSGLDAVHSWRHHPVSDVGGCGRATGCCR